MEAVYEIARELNFRGEHHAAYRFASTSRTPVGDSLFVHASVWNWGMNFKQSIAAYWVGRRDESVALATPCSSVTCRSTSGRR